MGRTHSDGPDEFEPSKFHCINYGPHRKDFIKFLSMRAVDNQGLGQFAPKESTQTLDIATYYMVSEDFFSIIHVATLIPGVWPFLTPGA